MSHAAVSPLRSAPGRGGLECLAGLHIGVESVHAGFSCVAKGGGDLLRRTSTHISILGYSREVGR